MNEKPPAVVEEALQGIKEVRKRIGPTLPVEGLADLVPSAVVLAVVVAVVIGAVVLARKLMESGMVSTFIR